MTKTADGGLKLVGRKAILLEPVRILNSMDGEEELNLAGVEFSILSYENNKYNLDALISNSNPRYRNDSMFNDRIGFYCDRSEFKLVEHE